MELTFNPVVFMFAFFALGMSLLFANSERVLASIAISMVGTLLAWYGSLLFGAWGVTLALPALLVGLVAAGVITGGE